MIYLVIYFIGYIVCGLIMEFSFDKEFKKAYPIWLASFIWIIMAILFIVLIIIENLFKNKKY